MRKLRRKKNKTQVTIVVCSAAVLLLIMTAGYAAFSTNITITAKGNLKDLKTEVDKNVPTIGLLTWMQADNNDNTNTVLKDKSGNDNDAIIYGATFTDDGLLFDGVDDYGIINNLDYNNSKAITIDFVSNIQKGSSDILFESSSNYNENEMSYLINIDDFGTNSLEADVHALNAPGSYNVNYVSNFLNYSKFSHYTVRFDTTKEYNNFIDIFLNGNKQSITHRDNNTYNISNNNFSNYPFYIGSRAGQHSFIHMIIKELIIYNRALTDEEIQNLDNGYKKKYKLIS